jgi:hypothetical protein
MLVRLCFTRPCLIGLCSIALVAASALAQEPGASSGPTVRPEIGKPIQAAIELLKSKKGKEALAKVREAQAVGERTPYENYLVERVLGQAAATAGEPAIAARAFENVATSPTSPEGERRQFLAAAASQYYLVKNYAKTTELAARYFKEGGTEKSMRTIYVQALYLGNDFAGAAKELMKDIEAEGDNKAPSEEQLQLLASSCSQTKDAACSGKAMEMLVAYYPKREYWLSVIYGIASRPGFSERLALDLARLKIETGTMRGAEEYLDAAQLSLQEGFPMEAVRIIDKGYASGVLGTGAEAARHKRLKDMAAKNLADDKKALAREESQSGAAKDGRALFNEGFNYVLLGKPEQGLALMEKGIRDAKAFRRLEHAKLQLGYAYHLAGQNQKAIQIWKTVQGADGAAALARLWAVRLNRAS